MDDFKTTKNFKSYVSKPEITDLAPNFLVKGSKNVLIDYAKRIISRPGYTLFGAANTGLGAIKSSYEWTTSSIKQFPLRAYDQKLEFYWNSTWNLLKSDLSNNIMEFAKVWDDTEKIDVLLWVLGEANTYKWSGAVTKVASGGGTSLTKQGVLTAKTTISFVAGTPGSVNATILDSASGFLTAGFAAGDTITVSGSTANNRNYTIASVTADVITLIMSDILTTEAAGPAITIHNGEPTWATSRFLMNGTRKIVYNGVEYAYTGGESTDTLTGLVGLPAVTTGDVVWQAPITLPNPAAINSNFKQDLIAVQLNQVILGSTKSQEIYGSKNNDYTNFTLTSPRLPADPFKVTMDNRCTCIVPMDNLAQTTSSLMFGAGSNEFFQLNYQMAQDLSNELVRMIKLKTAVGSGVISKNAVTPIKNMTAFISREPTLDTMGAVQMLEGKTNLPISDDIKDDFDSYDFTNAHMKYWKRAIYIALPAEGILLIYDLQRSLWQPPWTIPVGRLMVYNDWLYGHSSITNETYKLWDGTNDNGNYISQVARFAYNNNGRRDRIKSLSEYWTDGYISRNGKLEYSVNFGFDGVDGKKILTIDGNDPTIYSMNTGSPLGDKPIGSTPIGGGTLATSSGLNGMNRFWQADTMKKVDHIEHYVEYKMDTLDGKFAIVSHGSNISDAGTAIITHKK